MRQIISGIAIFLCLYYTTTAQPFVVELYDIDVENEHGPMTTPWFGGLNSPMFSNINLTTDTILDLFIYEKSTFGVYPMEGYWDNGVKKFRYAPEFTSKFPVVRETALIRDYNCDGISDLIALRGAGFEVYKGYYDGGEIAFTKVTNQLTYDGNKNIYGSPADKPDFVDMDGDGDMDAIGFNIGENALTYWRNESADLGYGCDSLIFTKETNVFGYARQAISTSRSFTLGTNLNGNTHQDNEVPDHSGSSIVVAFDQDGDGHMEILIGDEEYKEIQFLKNHGNGVDSFIWVDEYFPQYDDTVQLFHAVLPSYVDVTGDGRKDLLFSTFAPNYCRHPDFGFKTSENYNSVHFYKNVGVDTIHTFEKVTETFMSDFLMDVGEVASPVFVDYNADGLEDILIGTCYGRDDFTGLRTGLTAYENIGSSTAPKYKFVTNDWQGLNASTYYGIHPTFGDLDDDGDLDMVAGIYSTPFSKIYLFENTAGPGNPIVLQDKGNIVDSLTVFNQPRVQLVDVNNDGVLDLLTGESQGRVIYYKNIGTKSSPNFQFTTSQFGKVRNQFIDSSQTPPPTFTYNSTVYYGKLSPTSPNYLLLGGGNGLARLFKPSTVDPDSFVVADSFFLPDFYSTGASFTVSDLDNNSGGYEILVGNTRGGMHLYTIDKVVGLTQYNDQSFGIYPNPATHYIMINTENQNEKLKFEIFDLQGRLIKSGFNINGSAIQISELVAGPYFMKVGNDRNTSTLKFIKL